MNFSEFQPTELEFFAESDIVEIVPSFQGDVLNLISGDFGPFRPGIPVKVPLWLGVYLKKRAKCKVNAPEWLNVEVLTAILEQEKQLPHNLFTELPFNFEEVASLILKSASDDIKDATNVRGLVEDILNFRWSKLQDKLSKLQTGDTYLDLNNITNMEINKIKRSVELSFSVFQKIKSFGDFRDQPSSHSEAFSGVATQSLSQ